VGLSRSLALSLDYRATPSPRGWCGLDRSGAPLHPDRAPRGNFETAACSLFLPLSLILRVRVGRSAAADKCQPAGNASAARSAAPRP